MNTSNRFGMETVARQHQKEISDELATLHLLKEARLSMPKTVKSRRMLLRFVPTIIVLSLLLLYFFH